MNISIRFVINRMIHVMMNRMIINKRMNRMEIIYLHLIMIQIEINIQIQK